jgi:hypothetical protein
MAPTDLQGLHPDPALAPDIINNSWSCPPEEGCTDPTVLQTVVENVRASGILTVHSAGNSGPGCETSIRRQQLRCSFSVASDGARLAGSQQQPGTCIGDKSGGKPDIAALGWYPLSLAEQWL